MEWSACAASRPPAAATHLMSIHAQTIVSCTPNSRLAREFGRVATAVEVMDGNQLTATDVFTAQWGHRAPHASTGALTAARTRPR